MAEIIFDNVSKRFPDGTVTLNKACFTVRDGEFFILVGPSGCGKSTLLNMLVGLETVSDGEIRIDGQQINHLDPKDRNLAMVFQSYALYPHMSIRENIAFPLRVANVPKADIIRRVEATAAMLELTDLLDRKPASLSGGQRQRVAMGRALIREPKAFLLDEPLSNLDARLRVQMRAEIANLHKQLGITMLYVTHDQIEAMTLGDRIAVLNHGDIQQIGTPLALYREPANVFVASFMGAPSMNFLPAMVSESHVVLPMGHIPLTPALRHKIPPHGGPILVGFRPEHLCIAQSSGTSDSFIFPVAVDRVEWLGVELYLYFEIPHLETLGNLPWPKYLDNQLSKSKIAFPCIARFEANELIGAGENLSLAINTQHILYFDAFTGTRY